MSAPRLARRRAATAATLGALFFGSVVVVAGESACSLGLSPFVEDAGVDVAPPERLEAAIEAMTDTAVRADVQRPPDAGGARVFVTAREVPGGFGGVANGDALCQQAAIAAKLDGTFRAWLSTTGKAAIDRITGLGPWYLVDRKSMVIASRTAIADGPLLAIDRTEDGGTLDKATDTVWTGTAADGGTSNNCANFTMSQGAFGQFGRPVTGSKWTDDQADACTTLMHLYCFEQPH